MAIKDTPENRGRDHDPAVAHLQNHCLRLGHPVPFSYCLQPAQQVPCFRIIDCWWEVFDVVAHLKNILPEETYNRLLEDRRPPDRLQTIFDVVATLTTKRPDREEG